MFLRKAYNRLIGKQVPVSTIPFDFEEGHKMLIEKVKPFTMTSPERIFSLVEALKYIHLNGIAGDIVECGVWKGGSMLAVADTLVALGDTSRDLYLYDTFEGMPPPSAHDVNFQGEDAAYLLDKNKEKKDSDVVWAYSTLAVVKNTMQLSSYPAERIRYVQGKVEETLREVLPASIALLRLDTDWYESTKCELEYLFPLLQPGGVLIIDDYGFWQGARKAVDEYFSRHRICILLNRIDETGRIAVKQ
jgi:O-methyltransferase